MCVCAASNFSYARGTVLELFTAAAARLPFVFDASASSERSERDVAIRSRVHGTCRRAIRRRSLIFGAKQRGERVRGCSAETLTLGREMIMTAGRRRRRREKARGAAFFAHARARCTGS